ncbi:MAG: hypothetical protein ABIK28_23395, partial [Planctomycetota bacterium]
VMENHHIRMWNAASGSLLFTLKNEESIRSAGFAVSHGEFVYFTEKGMVKRVPVDDDLETLARSRMPERVVGGNASSKNNNPAKDPIRLNRKSWDEVRFDWDQVGGATTKKALKQAEEACRIDPENNTFRQTLGVALYRAGDFEGALQTLTPFLASSCPDTEGGYLTPPAFCAMAHACLGQSEEANSLFASFESKMKDPWERRFSAYQAFYEEAKDRVHPAPVVISHDDRKNAQTALHDHFGPYDFEIRIDPLIDPDHFDLPPILFTIDKTGNPDPCSMVCVCDLARTPRCLPLFTHNGDEAVACSASKDSRWLCYTQKESSGYTIVRRRLVTPWDGEASDPIPVCRLGPEYQCLPAWHPSGEKIYFSRLEVLENRGEMYGLYWAHARGSPDQAPQKIAGGPMNHFSDPRVSPDGRQLFFRHHTGSPQTYSREIWVGNLSADGTCFQSPRRLTWDSYHDKIPCSSPDGQWLLWPGKAEQKPFVRFSRMHSDGTEKTTLFEVVQEEGDYLLNCICFHPPDKILYQFIHAGASGTYSTLHVADLMGREWISISIWEAGRRLRLSYPIFLED